MGKKLGQNDTRRAPEGLRDPLYVVLDTNIVFRMSGRLLGKSDRKIFQAAAKLGITLVIPEIVIEELSNLFSKEVHETIRALRKLGGLIYDDAMKPQIPSNEAEIIAAYEQSLRASLKEVEAYTPGYDSIPQTRITSRIFGSRKPFSGNAVQTDDSSKGYRDSLLWESILNHVVGADRQIAFVSDNSADFGHRRETGIVLHPHLEDDLTKLGLPGSITLWQSLDELKKQAILPRLNRYKRATKFDLQSFIEKHDEDFLEQLRDKISHEESSLSSLLNIDISQPYIESYYEIDDIDIDDAREFEDGSVLIDVNFQTSLDLRFFVNKRDAYQLGSGSDVNIYDSDWNEWVMEAGANVQVQITANFVFDREIKRADSWEITSLTILGDFMDK